MVFGWVLQGLGKNGAERGRGVPEGPRSAVGSEAGLAGVQRRTQETRRKPKVVKNGR